MCCCRLERTGTGIRVQLTHLKPLRHSRGLVMLASKESQLRLDSLAPPQITLDTASGQLPADGQPQQQQQAAEAPGQPQPQQQQAVEAPGQQLVGGRPAQLAPGPGWRAAPVTQSPASAAVTQVRVQGVLMHAVW